MDYLVVKLNPPPNLAVGGVAPPTDPDVAGWGLAKDVKTDDAEAAVRAAGFGFDADGAFLLFRWDDREEYQVEPNPRAVRVRKGQRRGDEKATS